MADVWSNVAALDPGTQELLAGVLETRGADPRQQDMRRRFLSGLAPPPSARALDVGCGTGVLTRALAELPGVASVTGVDLAPSLIERARELTAGSGLAFQVGDATALPFGAESFDLVVFDSTLSHVPDPPAALREAYRVLSRGGRLGVFDGDYATATVALEEHDPLQVSVNAMMSGSVGHRFVVRALTRLVRDCGFTDVAFTSHGFAETTDGAYMLSVVDRGADILGARGLAGAELVAALKAEARRRVAHGTFFGHIAYAGVTAGRGD